MVLDLDYQEREPLPEGLNHHGKDCYNAVEGLRPHLYGYQSVFLRVPVGGRFKLIGLPAV